MHITDQDLKIEAKRKDRIQSRCDAIGKAHVDLMEEREGCYLELAESHQRCKAIELLMKKVNKL